MNTFISIHNDAHDTASIQSIKLTIEKSKQVTQERISSKIVQMQDLMYNVNLRLDTLMDKLPLIELALYAKGLGIKELKHSKSGEQDKWEKDDVLNVHITAIPTSDKFKFIKFAGYTKKGEGKNQQQLNVKSNLLEEFIEEKTGITSVAINPYSLELKDDTDTRNILIDLRIK